MKYLNKIKLSRILDIQKNLIMIDYLKYINKKNAIAEKIIKKNDKFLKSHLISSPVFPGFILQESILQTIVAILKNQNVNKNYIIAHANIKFLLPVKNGRLLIKAKILNKKNKIIKAEGNLIYKNKKSVSGNFVFFEK